MVQYQDKVESATTSTTFTASCGDALGWTALQRDSCFADMAEFKRFFGMQESLNTKYQQYTTRGTITKDGF
jgi:hypothetical protein